MSERETEEQQHLLPSHAADISSPPPAFRTFWLSKGGTVSTPYLFLAFVSGILVCLLPQYVFSGSSCPSSMSSADDSAHVLAPPYVGSTEVHNWPPPSPTNDLPTLFPTNVGHAGVTPTGAEPALVLTAPSYPIHTGAAQLVLPPALHAGGKSNKGFDLFKKWGNLSPWYSVKRGTFGVNSDPGIRQTLGLPLAVLTPFGRQQLFDLGISIRLKYGFLLQNFTDALPVFRTESQDRMLASALNFAAGFWGIPYEDKYLQSITIEAGNFNNTLAPYMTCPNAGVSGKADRGTPFLKEWTSVYLKETRDRLQGHIDGYALTIEDVYTMQQMCAYETVAIGFSKFCGLFTEEEWEGFNYGYTSAFGAPLARAQGIGYIQELVARLTHTPIQTHNSSTNSTLDDSHITFPLDHNLYVDATHEVVVLNIITALNLSSFAANGPLPTDHIPKQRSFRVSELAPFSTNVQFQLLSCPSRESEQIRIIVNDAVAPLTGIEGCPEDADGMCPVATFVAAQKKIIASTDWAWACHGDWEVPAGHEWNTTTGDVPVSQ
ncbi:phosphoglycerate mutase-like protein [Lactarius akahatsu]|uniref:Phosphoglycerate mutase-like protein n=1 Tax=Lactarius akahatsu TaxID=416441 RepID=A0AAD4LQZ1_9AGAM|nr:phosphoglycerate mutase-like protein [Lactarius akahatsu]